MEEARVLVDLKAIDPEGPDPFGVIGQTLLGRYRVLRVAGRGGQGVVYEAEHERLKRSVAIKFLLVDATEGPTALKRFEREAEILARLSHPSIVHVYDIATHSDGETPIMVMEFVRGEALSVRLQDRRRTPWREAFALVAQAAGALAAAHAQDIIHRDIKPDNLLVCEDGTVKVLDFGIAQLITELSNTEDGRAPRRRLTAKNVVPGTAGYMSPEQFIAGMRLDGRSDVYSLGVVLYRLLCAKRLWPTVERHEIAQLIQTQDPVDIRIQVPDLPDHAAAVVRRAIARDRQERFASMDALRDALKAALDDESATTSVAAGADVSPIEARSASTPPQPSETSHVGGGAHRMARPLGLVVGAAMVGLCVTAWITLFPRLRPAEPAPHGTTASSPAPVAPSPPAPVATPPSAASPTPAHKRTRAEERRDRAPARQHNASDADTPAYPFGDKP